jgi:hypothetical protein
MLSLRFLLSSLVIRDSSEGVPRSPSVDRSLSENGQRGTDNVSSVNGQLATDNVSSGNGERAACETATAAVASRLHARLHHDQPLLRPTADHPRRLAGE